MKKEIVLRTEGEDRTFKLFTVTQVKKKVEILLVWWHRTTIPATIPFVVCQKGPPVQGLPGQFSEALSKNKNKTGVSIYPRDRALI